MMKEFISLLILLCYISQSTQQCGGGLQRSILTECTDAMGNLHVISPVLVKQAQCSFQKCDCTKWMIENNVSRLPPTNPCLCKPSATSYVSATENETNDEIKCLIVTKCNCEPLSD